MKIVPLSQDLIPQVRTLMETGDPYIRVRTNSDYWLYATLFSTTCPVATIDGTAIAAVIAFRSQDDPGDVYIQDVITHPDHRGHGLATALVDAVKDWAHARGCARLYLTSEPDNTAAHTTWTKLGFINVPGTYTTDGIHVTADFKGPGKDRAVYELRLTTPT